MAIIIECIIVFVISLCGILCFVLVGMALTSPPKSKNTIKNHWIPLSLFTMAGVILLVMSWELFKDII